jgi:hypothetical protein
MSDTGTSRQIKLTPWRVRGIIASLAAMAALVVIGMVGMGGYFSSDAALVSERDSLLERVKVLEEELRQKELALSSQSQGIGEVPQNPTLVTAPPAAPRREPPVSEEASNPSFFAAAEAEAGPETESSPLEAWPPDNALSDPVASSSQPPDEFSTPDAEAREPDPAPEPEAEPEVQDREQRMAALNPPQPAPEPETPRLSFNADRLTAIVKGEHEGLLKFRLIKDHPEVSFAGRLFVFVEMMDEKGRAKLYAYPKKARLGEGHMPVDFRQGQNVEPFKYNTGVELPYRDYRPGARLSYVSILLYDKDGRIVFQRGFERGAVRRVQASAPPGRNQMGEGRRRRPL